MDDFVLFFRDMNIEKTVWLVSAMIGFTLSVYGVLYWFSQKGRSERHYAKAAVFEFAACWVLYFPEEFFNDITCPNNYLRFIESVFTALLKSFNVYAGNGYERTEFANHVYFSSGYGILRVISNLLLLLFVGGFIVKFLDGPLQWLKLWMHKKRYTYVFTECNDKTLAIAKSILSRSKKKNIVFVCSTKELSPEHAEQIGLIGGIYLEASYDKVIRIFRENSSGLEIFLFNKSEEINLIQLERICNMQHYHQNAAMKIYVELLKTPWNLYDNFVSKCTLQSDDKVLINFVRAEENFVYNDLLKTSIFENYLIVNGSRKIHVLIVGGMNDRNFELLKAVLHLGQMPGYRLTVTVVDSGIGRDKLRQKMPEVYDECCEEGNAIYSIHYLENIDYESEAFDKKIEESASDFTFAFINAGEDLTNVNIALRINAMCYRIKREEVSYKIQVNVLNQGICGKWNREYLTGIEFVGSVDKTYAYDFVTMSDIEKGTKAIHDARHAGTKSWESYCNNEYNRHSVYARTLSFKYKVWLIENEYDSNYEITSENSYDENGVENNPWKIYEHMRWNMYTRTLGYRCCKSDLLNENGELDRKTRMIAKVHNDLVHFNQLDVEEQKKDALKLTPEIVEILKNI